MNECISQSVTEVFLEQPVASPGSAYNFAIVEIVYVGCKINAIFYVSCFTQFNFICALSSPELGQMTTLKSVYFVLLQLKSKNT